MLCYIFTLLYLIPVERYLVASFLPFVAYTTIYIDLEGLFFNPSPERLRELAGVKIVPCQ